MPETERAKALKDRLEEIRDIAIDLIKDALKKVAEPTSFALSIAGAAWTLKTGGPVGALLAGAAAIVRSGETKSEGDAGAYSYSSGSAIKYPYCRTWISHSSPRRGDGERDERREVVLLPSSGVAES